MATGNGPSLGEAIMDLVQTPPARTVRQQVQYVLSPRTGASAASVARQLGVRQRTVLAWQAGRKPAGRSARKIQSLYERFYRINHRTKPEQRVSTGELRITNTSDPRGITIQGRPQNPLIVERSTRRRWDRVLGASDPDEALRWFIADVLGPSPLPPVGEDYLKFWPGSYSVTAG